MNGNEVQPQNERIEAIVTTGNSDESHHEDDHLAGTNADPSCFEGEEPTEEEVALAMRLQNPCDMLKEDDPSAGRSYEESAQKTSFDRGAHTQGEETTPCSACGSSEEPHFVHYKKCETAIGSAGGAFIWRYRCGKEECAQFFGDFYAYDKVSNSFVRVSEDGGVPEDAEDENGDVEEQPIPQATEAPPTIVDQSPEESPLEERQGSNCDSVETTADSSGDPRSRRRQRATARKKTATPSITKVSPNSKKLEKRSNNRTIKIVHKTPPKRNSKSPPKAPVRTAKPVKSAKVLKTPAPKRRREKTLEPAISDAAIVPKKLRKGYVLEPISPSLQHLNSLENPPNMNGTQQPTYSESSTQTLGGTHYFSVLIEELINGEADFYSGTTSEARPILPTHISRRLMVSQQLLKRQSEELLQAHEENKRLMTLVTLMNAVVKKFRDEYTPELRHLRDTIGVIKREFSFYQDEFVVEAKKSIDSINMQKNEVQQRIDDVERKNRLLNARIDLHIKEKEAIEERADGYLREISARDREVILANKARDRAERKLGDTLYVANNAKCAHCQISDKMRKHLTDVVAEKTVLLEKCQKECIDAVRRADQADRISQILSKDSEKLRFELNRWKSDAERNITEITRLKEELKKVTSNASGTAVSNTASQTPRSESFTSKQSSHCNASPAPNHVGKLQTSNDSGSTPSKEMLNSSQDGVAKIFANNVEGSVVRPPPIPPVMPTPPEEPDSPFTSWLPKERRVDCSPPVTFFNSPSTTSKHGCLIPSVRKNHPFNGPVFSERSAGRRNGPSVGSSSTKEDEKSIDRTGEKLSDQSIRKVGPLQPVVTATSTEMGNVRQQHDTRSSDQSCTGDNVPMIGKLPSKMTRNNQKTNGANTSTSRLFDVGAQKTTAQPSLRQSGKSGKTKVKTAKKNVFGGLHQHKNAKTIPSLMSVCGPPPFNGPVSFFEEGHHRSRSPPESHPSDTIRMRFSSSPLPWHRGGAATDYEVWDRAGYPPASPSQFERRSLFDNDLLPGRPFTQRARKNFWEP
ncbi:hypothetical protein RB195_012550 [Necator americanus]|uniref:Uncharacterized protein n=1 Tax=Necator americanus TaxID=51031 RepID=A0ABR1DU54_NECAM